MTQCRQGTSSCNQSRRNQLVEPQPSQVEFVQDFPDIPVLTKTLLFLDLLVQEPCIDLREMSQLVLSDLGATLQILRLAGREFGNADDRPVRMEDCISDLGLEACLKAVSRKPCPRRPAARHRRLLGPCQGDCPAGHADCKADVQGKSRRGLSEQVCFILSACCRSFWDGGRPARPMCARWAPVCDKRSLPACVTEFFREIHFTGYPTLWSGIVRQAHQRANRSVIECPFGQGPAPTW